MKKVIVATILGLAAANSFGQGAIQFDNYTQGTYNQVVWGPGVPGHVAGTAVSDVPVSMQLYFAEGTGLTFGQLSPGVIGDLDLTRTFGGAAGVGGWFSGATQLLPTWAAGDTFTFAVVVTGPGGYFGQSALWTETAAIHSSMVPVSGFLNFPGLTVNVPEPTTFALAGLGSAALLIFRRRRA
jgi:hypothetical protein